MKKGIKNFLGTSVLIGKLLTSPHPAIANEKPKNAPPQPTKQSEKLEERILNEFHFNKDTVENAPLIIRSAKTIESDSEDDIAALREFVSDNQEIISHLHVSDKSTTYEKNEDYVKNRHKIIDGLEKEEKPIAIRITLKNLIIDLKKYIEKHPKTSIETNPELLKKVLAISAYIDMASSIISPNDQEITSTKK